MLNGHITYLQSPSWLAALRSIPMWLQDLYLATIHESGCKYWCFLPQWKSGHEHCLHNWFQFCHLTYYGTRIRLWVSMCSLEYNYIVQKRDGVDSDTDYTGFHVHSYYASGRVFIFGFSPHPTHHIIKQTDNWESKREKEAKQPVSDLFGTAFKALGSIQGCISQDSQKPFSFEISEMKKQNCKICYIRLLC